MRKLQRGVNDLATLNPQLAKEWHPKKNGDLKPSDIFANSNKKYWWLYTYDDPNTGKHFDLEWEASPNNRIRNGGTCPFISSGGRTQLYKGFNDLETQFPELAQEWHPTKNGDLKPSDVLPQSAINVWWYLPYDDPNTGKHFDFEWQTPLQHRTVKKYSCPFLSNSSVWLGFNDLATTHPELANQWHPTKNGNLKPTDVTFGSNKKVWWYLPYDDPNTGKHFDFEWEVSIDHRTIRKSGCPFLSNSSVWLGFNDLATTHPELANQWHPTKNGNLKPTDVTFGSGLKVWWLYPYDDPITGNHFDFEWTATINSRIDSDGSCPFLSGKSVWSGYNDLATTNPKLSKEWHPTKNGKLTPFDISKGYSKKVWWLGKCGHEWQALTANRAKGIGCPICANQIIQPGVNDLATTHPELVEEWDYEKNKPLLPTMVTHGTERKVWWLCQKGHSWNSYISPRAMRGIGCPVCSNEQSTSFPEYAILYYFSQVETKVIHSYKELGYEIDIYIPSKKVGIEYDGSFWHKDKKQKDIEKNNRCKADGITLYRFRENDLGVLNDSSIDIVCHEKEFASKLSELIEKLYHVQIDIDLDRDFANINEYREFTEKEKSLANTYPSLASEWDFEKNGKLTPEHVLPKSGKKVWWKCSKGHEWMAIISSRVNGNGCPFCSGKKVLEGYNDLATTNPELASEWNYDKNKDLTDKKGNTISTPKQITSGSSKKVWWLGKCGHEWKTSIVSRVNGTGCPICANIQVLKGYNDLATLYPTLASEWNYDKNIDIFPNEVKPSEEKVVWWKCVACGAEYQRSILSRTSKGYGCPVCGKNNSAKSKYKKVKNLDTGKVFDYVRQLENEPCADLILSHPVMARK